MRYFIPTHCLDVLIRQSLLLTSKFINTRMDVKVIDIQKFKSQQTINRN